MPVALRFQSRNPDFSVGIQGNPAKYNPGKSVTPLACIGKPSASKMGNSPYCSQNDIPLPR